MDISYAYLYEIQLGVEVEGGPSSVAVGCFIDKEVSGLAVIAKNGVVLYQPQRRKEGYSFDGKVNAVAASRLNDERDALVIGLTSVLVVRDLGKACQLFRIDLADGLSSLSVGYGKILIGGNCSLLCVDCTDGTELFWTVASDQVSAIAQLDAKQAIVGSEDHGLQLLSDEDAICSQVIESGRLTALVALPDQSYGFGLANGTIGVYRDSTRLWRKKYKDRLMGLVLVDETALASGLSDGSVSVFDAKTGTALWEVHLKNAVAFLAVADLAVKNQFGLIACDIHGNCHGLIAPPAEESSLKISESEKKRLALETQLTNLKKSTPKIHTRLELMNSNTLTLVLDAKTSTLISAVVIDPEDNVFSHRLAAWPSKAASILRIPLFPRKQMAADLKILAQIVQQKKQSLLELDFRLPRFCRFVACAAKQGLKLPAVRFMLVDLSLNDFCDWLEDSFVHLSESHHKDKLSRGETISYVSTAASSEDNQRADLAPGEFLCFEVTTDLHITLYTKNLAVASEIIQELCTTFKVQELDSSADPDLFHLGPSLQEANRIPTQPFVTNDLQALRVHIMDSTHLFDFDTMKQRLDSLTHSNKRAFEYHADRLKQHNAQQAAVTELNLLIQRAANLRSGQAKATLIAEARTLLKPLLSSTSGSLVALKKSELDDLHRALLSLLSAQPELQAGEETAARRRSVVAS